MIITDSTELMVRPRVGDRVVGTPASQEKNDCAKTGFEEIKPLPRINWLPTMGSGEGFHAVSGIAYRSHFAQPAASVA